MQLTYMSGDFKALLLTIAVAGFIFSWVAEKSILPSVAAFIGAVKRRMQPGKSKKRKEYKTIDENLRI